MTSRAGRPQRDLVPPSRLNAFQLHYLDRVIPEFQKGSSSFTAYDESLEAAYDWLRNFEDALKNNAYVLHGGWPGAGGACCWPTARPGFDDYDETRKPLDGPVILTSSPLLPTVMLLS